jgi:hypothetical protein
MLRRTIDKLSPSDPRNPRLITVATPAQCNIYSNTRSDHNNKLSSTPL